MAPVDYTYFDYTQASGEPGAPWEGNDNGPTSIGKILSWEPVPDSFSPAEARHVLGVEAAVWTEFIASERYLEFMTFPRVLAFSEIAWSPKAKRDEAEFNIRLARTSKACGRAASTPGASRATVRIHDQLTGRGGAGCALGTAPLRSRFAGAGL